MRYVVFGIYCCVILSYPFYKFIFVLNASTQLLKLPVLGSECAQKSIRHKQDGIKLIGF